MPKTPSASAKNNDSVSMIVNIDKNSKKSSKKTNDVHPKDGDIGAANTTSAKDPEVKATSAIDRRNQHENGEVKESKRFCPLILFEGARFVAQICPRLRSIALRRMQHVVSSTSQRAVFDVRSPPTFLVACIHVSHATPSHALTSVRGRQREPK